MNIEMYFHIITFVEVSKKSISTFVFIPKPLFIMTYSTSRLVVFLNYLRSLIEKKRDRYKKQMLY